MVRLPWIIWGRGNVITTVFIRGRQESQRDRRQGDIKRRGREDVMTEAEVRVMSGHKPRNGGSFQKLEKATIRILP